MTKISHHEIAQVSYAISVSTHREVLDRNAAAMIDLLDRHYAPERVADPDWRPWTDLHDDTLLPLQKGLDLSTHSEGLKAAVDRARQSLLHHSNAATLFPSLAAAGSELPLANVSVAVSRMREKARDTLAAGGSGLMDAVRAFGAKRELQRSEKLDHRQTRLAILDEATTHTIAARLVLRDKSVVNAERVARDIDALADATEHSGGGKHAVARLRATAQSIAAGPAANRP